MDIDNLLAQSAPPRVERTPEIREALRLLVADAEGQVRAPRRRRRRVLLAAGAAVFVGLGATAAGFMPDWVPWTTGEGSSCNLQFEAKPNWPDGDASAQEHSAQNDSAVEEANRFLATFDLDSVDEAQAIEDLLREDAAVRATMPPQEQAPPWTGDDLAVNAVYLKVARALDAHLTALGLTTSDEAVGLKMTWECE